MFSRERAKGPRGFTVVLNKDVIPYFEHVGIILVYEMCSIPSTDTVIMDFADRVVELRM